MQMINSALPKGSKLKQIQICQSFVDFSFQWGSLWFVINTRGELPGGFSRVVIPDGGIPLIPSTHDSVPSVFYLLITGVESIKST